ncbi:MAG: amidohydrolase [Anaerolineaceae bacterium]|nr:amidohydrolase [Anaerolineaceae bacterium]
MEFADLLLTHALIVTQDDRRTIVPDGAIAIRGGRIQALGSTREIMERYDAKEKINLSGQIIFPGLINTHDHLFQVATKGLGEDLPVQDWVTVVTAPIAANITPQEMYLFCLTGCLELIHSGVTTVVDMSYMAHSFELHEENIRAMCESGLRSRYTTIISDFGRKYGILPELIKPIDWFIDEYDRLLQKYPPEDRMTVWIAIGATWTITAHGLKKVLGFSRKTGTPMVMHVNENWLDNQSSRDRFGKNNIPYLAETGFLRPELLAIHCVDLDDTDIELFARHGVRVSYNPVSNMYLGSGIPPMMKMEQAGLTISLGVDGAGSNNSQDMIETLKAAALLQKVAARDASVVNAQQVLDWATRGGARTLGLEKEIGSLEEGKRADLFVVAPNTAKVVPIHDPVATLVYSCGEENVVMTLADGIILMRDRVIQHLDEKEIVQRCQQVGLALAERCGSNSKVRQSWKRNSR